LSAFAIIKISHHRNTIMSEKRSFDFPVSILIRDSKRLLAALVDTTFAPARLFPPRRPTHAAYPTSAIRTATFLPPSSINNIALPLCIG
jgi:hypothetical protein